MNIGIWPSRLLLIVLLCASGPLLAQTQFEAPGGVAAQNISNSTIKINSTVNQELRCLCLGLAPMLFGNVLVAESHRR